MDPRQGESEAVIALSIDNEVGLSLSHLPWEWCQIQDRLKCLTEICLSFGNNCMPVSVKH